MIGPVSGTGRAMMSSLQQAMQKGMPPDQAIQYVKSMATQGVAPLADLYAMMNQFQRLKQPQAQAPQTPPTIKDQLNMLDQQQRMQGGIAGMQAPPPAPQPMDRGLGAVDAGRMQYPQFAGGGIVAFAEGGAAGIDFSKMTNEQLEMLFEGEDKELARAALKERLDRSGYTPPRELWERYTEAVKAGIPKGPAIRFDLSGGAPAYMKDEQGRIRTPGMGKPVTSSFTEGIVPMERPAPTPPAAAATQSAVPTGGVLTPYSSPQEAGAAFDRRIAQAQEGVRQEPAPARSRPGTAMATTGGGRGGDRYAELRRGVEGRTFEEVADSFSPEEEKRINKALSGLTAEKKDAVRMALAEAGFRMAAAASRPGATTLSSLSEGALGGMQQYRAAQKELRQTEKELGKEMADLRKYQDQVARGERTAKRDFEERKQRDILDLEVKSEQLRQFNAELGQRLQIAQLQYGEDNGQSAYRRSTLTINMLDPMYKAAVERLNAIADVPPVGVKPQSPEHKALIAAAQKKVNDLEAQMRAAASGGAGGASPVPSQSAVPDAVLAALSKYTGG